MLSESIHLPKSIKDAENRFIVVLKEQLLKIVKELNGKLSLSGGVMNGEIQFKNPNGRTFAINKTNSGNNMDIGWNWQDRDGAGISLRSTDDISSTAGSFSIYARDGTNTATLNGSPNGTLYWNGKRVTAYGNVETITPTVNTTNVASVGSYQYCCRCGVVVSLGLNIQVKASAASGGVLVSGFPAPPARIGCILGSPSVPLRCYIDTDGALKLDGASPSSAQWFNGCITYITNS